MLHLIKLVSKVRTYTDKNGNAKPSFNMFLYQSDTDIYVRINVVEYDRMYVGGLRPEVVEGEKEDFVKYIENIKIFNK